MAAAWPATLPGLNIVLSFGEQLGDGTERTAMDEGPDKTRRTPTPEPDTIQLTQLYDRSQIQLIHDFYKITLAHGALPFEESHPTLDISKTFRFTSPPKYQHRSGTKYIYSLELEILS